jgi:ApaG protein
MSIQSTHISVSVSCRYRAEFSQNYGRHIYSYTITIANAGPETAQLVSRHWRIRDANGALQEVQGLGVVGEQPHIHPGDQFTYSSAVVLDTETGIMEGVYHMLAPCGSTFNVTIPAFALVPPHALH